MVFVAMGHSALLSPLLSCVDGACGKELPASSMCFPVPTAMLAQGETNVSGEFYIVQFAATVQFVKVSTVQTVQHACISCIDVVL